MAEIALELYFDKYIANGSEGQDPEGQDPGGQDPEGQDPGGQDPEGQDPGGQDPGGQDPGGQDPEGQDPGGQDPGGQDPSEDEDMDCDIFSLPDELLTLGPAADKESSTSLDHSAHSPVKPVEPVKPETPQIQLPHVPPRIQNVVSMVDLGCSLDLNAIAHQAWNIQYNPRVLKALIMRIRKPATTAMIHSSGKMVSLGAKSAQDSYLATRRFGRIVQRLGFPVRFLDFKVVNIVANARVPPLRLEPLAQHHLCSYEPELFPALFLKGFHGVSINVYPSGNILMMGAKTEETVQQAFSRLVPFISSFRKP